MKILNKFFSASAVALTLLALSGCVSEAPFDGGKEGTLRLTAQLRGDVTSVITRAADYDQQTLENNLVVYIQKENVGVVRKFLGLESLQGANISLQTGRYVLEGWTGDSVSASFDKKFYYGYMPVDIKEGSNSIALKCDIANVLASVNTELVADQASELSVEIWHSKGTLVFDNERLVDDRKGEQKGYFMMPKNDKTLHYKITGKSSDGSPFSKDGEINNVLRAHDYQFVLKSDASQVTQGGALIKLEIVEVPVIDEEVTVFPAPSFKGFMSGKSEDLSRQIDASSPAWSWGDLSMRVLAYKGLASLKLSFSDNFPVVGGSVGLDVVADGASSLPVGIDGQLIESEDYVANSDEATIKVHEYWLNLSSAYLSSLPVSEKEYCITIDAEDGRGYVSQMKLRWANSEGAVERLAPVGSYGMDEMVDYTAVSARSAVLNGALFDDSVDDYGIKIRPVGTQEWTSIPATKSRAFGNVSKFSVKATGLMPATLYEYKSYAGNFEEETSHTFTTEGEFVIPNSSLEDWSNFSENSNVLLPGGGGVRSFWDSGNHGSGIMGVTLTKNIESPIHSGNYSAQLRSQLVGVGVAGKFAAGNLFVGEYLETQGTDGRLQFGRQYNGSHPNGLRLWANYRPGKVEKAGSIADCTAADKVAVGDIDKGQIYVALTTEPVEVRTKKSTRKLFDPNEDVVLAYGEVTWSEAFGPDGALQEVNIPLKYKNTAKTVKPKYLVIVCSASKFGDYFCGGEGSIMIVDDFELVY